MNLEDKHKVETILFTTGKFLALEELSKLTSIASIGYLQEIIQELQKDYAQRTTSLEIIQQGDKWKLGIRKAYLHLTETLLTDSELDRPTQETLAVVAYKSPALQSDIIKIRGNKAYEHIQTLKELDLVTAEKSGRTRLLKVTNKFYDYFDVVEDQLKSKFATLNKTDEEKIKQEVAAIFGESPLQQQNPQEQTPHDQT